MDGRELDHLMRTFGAIGAERQGRLRLRAEARAPARPFAADAGALARDECWSGADDRSAELLNCGPDAPPRGVVGSNLSRPKMAHGR